MTTIADRVKPSHDEAGATRSAEDHHDGVGRQRFVCYSCKQTGEYLADCEGVDCKRMHRGVCPKCGEQNT